VKHSDIILQEIDVVVLSMNETKRLAAELAKVGDSLEKNLNDLQDKVRCITEKRVLNNGDVLIQLSILSNRLSRLQELRKMSEFGSFSMEIQRTMQTVWESLPQ